MKSAIWILALGLYLLGGCEKSSPTPPLGASGKPDPAAPPVKEEFHIYMGNTHAHTNYSGDVVAPRIEQGLAPDPDCSVENHLRLARQNGYDFYFITDHSQYDVFTDAGWADTRSKVEDACGTGFVSLRGYEHSENNGPDGKGHMNVYCTDGYLNALNPQVSVAYFHDWLCRAENRNAVVCFNHPDKDAYNDFRCYNEAVRERMKLIELINGTASKYPAFVNALSKGWKVSPVSGCDNHGWQGIAKWTARTGIVARVLTPSGLVEAMNARRTYATFDTNLQVMYYADNYPMGAEFKPSDNRIEFSVTVADPDTDKPVNKITRLEIVGAGGAVAASKDFSTYKAEWTVTVTAGSPYYYLIVYNASSAEPIAYAAPVWIKKNDNLHYVLRVS